MHCFDKIGMDIGLKTVSNSKTVHQLLKNNTFQINIDIALIRHEECLKGHCLCFIESNAEHKLFMRDTLLFSMFGIILNMSIEFQYTEILILDVFYTILESSHNKY